MSFERGDQDHHHQNHLSPPPPQDHQQEAKTPPSFLMNIMASTTNKPYSNTSSNTFLDPQQHHHQSHHQLQFIQHQDHHPHHHHHHHDTNQISFAMINHSMAPSSSNNPTTTNNNNLMRSNDGGGPYDLADLDQALFLYGEGQGATLSSVQDHQRRDPLELMRAEGSASSGMRPPTLNIFPSQPMHVVDPSTSTTKANTGLVSPSSSGSRRPSDQQSMENIQKDATPPAPQSSKAIKREGNKKGPTTSSDQGRPKTPDPKTLRRLAQNREAARKSRLRKKAYVQQLESSRIKLTQLEQELQRARAQVIISLFRVYLGGGGGVLGGDQGVPLGMNNISSDAAVFDMEYARWLEDYHRQMCELQAAVQEHLPENELRIYVDNCIARIDDVMNLKSIVAKSDVFHIISGTWKTPAERCFMWIGGFRPSELIKIILGQIEPLTEQQLMAICEVQQATQEAEDALTQGLDALNQSLSDTIASDALSSPTNMANYMGQMAAAMNKLSTLESFVIQADNLRRQTIHHVLQLLTTRQAARSLLAVAEHFHRLRSLSSLWVARPRQD
ncbi:hypothetical protein OSB04_001285 [Centaurea solstitialis]|uniref:Uncharacterized protein n=1 Tax=Centaurea solstitialis TaxID=347529 RepID=A0AA38TR11_9ASTR|nr:hypothetical protein OSB04_001285 [Centaurea solstitialis]